MSEKVSVLDKPKLEEKLHREAVDKAYGGKSTPASRRIELERRFLQTKVDNERITSGYRIEL